MENERLSIEEIVAEYKDAVLRLSSYIPWLETKCGQKVSGIYAEDGIEKSSLGVPVYDATLLSLIKAAKGTNLMDRNYAYAYSRYRMKNAKDELTEIAKAKMKDIPLLKGILSKYVLGGMTRSVIWAEGVETGVFLQVLLKLKELMEFYEGPLA